MGVQEHRKKLMPSIFLETLVVCVLFLEVSASIDGEFTFNGFQGANLSSDGVASVMPNGLLRLTNLTMHATGHAFHPTSLLFKNSQIGSVISFSTTFVFAIVPGYPLGGMGMAFVLSPSKNLSGATHSQYLGLFNPSNNGNLSNHIAAVELDTSFNPEFKDINDNHVGIDIDSLVSTESYYAGYFTNDGKFRNLTLMSGEPMQVWIDYDGKAMQLNVTLSPFKAPKPNHPILSSNINLSSVFFDRMYAGFSASTGTVQASHYILGWSFKLDGIAQPLDYSKLPHLPRSKSKRRPRGMAIWIPILVLVFFLVTAAIVLFVVRRKNKFAEILEDWELEYGTHRFSYRDLYRATHGFKDSGLLGVGGFGRVYKGVLRTSNTEVAVKRVSHESKQGVREFVAEITSIGQLRHRSLVQLLGYCRRKGELLLVYEFMPNGSLDKLLFDQKKSILDWAQRLRIINGVALGLLYLHEDCEQVIVHRDIKASNVLLDGELNGKLGDFGLARLYDHGSDPRSTIAVGTMGYLAPELTKRGKVTTSTDVFAFGAFLLEVACGRRPIEPRASKEETVLVDWVMKNWRRGAILGVVDWRLQGQYAVEEVELVLKLGLLCSHPSPVARPSMRKVIRILDGVLPMPELVVDQ
ncbi:L-type lectin-domain containing receptor kinase SIT2-like [Phoenix dactylifera]|uniref:non-specific serine/threonine protein kinase n=1 Tax=Phoenix dactylifera TaxID=42345 RepID=A0A8B7C2Z3_PHODC|nr:L-type lectin-domain containing receptor kinase SIT2-like [Phoenix dactylifera]